jgi:hypothetical protein
LLLQAGADINWQSSKGTTLLDSLIYRKEGYYRHWDSSLKIIIAAGFDFNAYQHSVKDALQMEIHYDLGSQEEIMLLCANSSLHTLTSIQFCVPEELGKDSNFQREEYL